MVSPHLTPDIIYPSLTMYMTRMSRSGRALATTLKEWGGSSSVHGVSYVFDREAARVDRGVWGILVSLLLWCFCIVANLLI